MPSIVFRLPCRRLLAASAVTWAIASGSAHGQGTLPKPIPSDLPAPKKIPVAEAIGGPVRRYTLPEALAIGHEKHPQLHALRASMNAALIKQRGIGEASRFTGILLPDLDYRKQQSDLGLRAAMAEYEQAQHEVTYAVVRCYYTVVYAKAQQRVAKDFVDQLNDNLELLRKILYSKDAPPPKGDTGINRDTEQKLETVIGEAKKKLLEAKYGIVRANAALTEAMGLDPIERVDVADEVLPEVRATLDRDTVVRLAVTRRGEVILAAIGGDVTRLEIDAQAAKHFGLSVPTFANAGDIHARPVPAAQRDPDYKPGAIGPEMPDRIIGKVKTRTAVAAQYAVRADEAARQVRSLVGLEAKIALSRYEQASERVEIGKKLVKTAKELNDRLRDAAGGLPLKKEDVLTTEVSVVRVYADYNEALWEQMLALTNLERITAGGVRVNFLGR